MIMRDRINAFVRQEAWGQLLLDLERDRAWALPSGTFPTGTGIVAYRQDFSALFAENPFRRDGAFRLGLENVREFPLSAPLSISWSVTNRCNCACAFCCNDSGACKGEELGLADICKIIDVLEQWKTFRVILGGGEPFCRKDILQILEYFREKGIRPALATNATLVKEEQLPLIAQTCMSLQISLDTLIPQRYHKMRGVDALPHVLHIIEKALPMINVRVVTVLTEENFSELDSIAEHLHKLGVGQWFVFTLLPSGRGAKVWQDQHVDEDRAKEKLRTLAQTYTDMCIWYWGAASGDGISTYIEPEGSFALVDYHNNTRQVLSSGQIRLEDMMAIWDSISPEAQSATVKNFTSPDRTGT